MECRRRFDKIARKIFVVRVLFDELIRIDRRKYFMTRYVPPVELMLT